MRERFSCLLTGSLLGTVKQPEVTELGLEPQRFCSCFITLSPPQVDTLHMSTREARDHPGYRENKGVGSGCFRGGPHIQLLAAPDFELLTFGKSRECPRAVSSPTERGLRPSGPSHSTHETAHVDVFENHNMLHRCK